MTEFTVRLKTDKTLSKQEAYLMYGVIAEALDDTIIGSRNPFDLVEITDDVAASAPAEPPAPKPARKPRGPNKAKVQEPSDPPPAGDSPMPDFLKRGA